MGTTDEKVTLTTRWFKVTLVIGAMAIVAITNGLVAHIAAKELDGQNVVEFATNVRNWFVFISAIAVIIAFFTKSIAENVKGILCGLFGAIAIGAQLAMMYYANGASSSGRYETLLLDIFLTGVMIAGVSRNVNPLSKPASCYMLLGSHLGVDVYQYAVATGRENINLPILPHLDGIHPLAKYIVFGSVFFAMMFLCAYFEENGKLAFLRILEGPGYILLFFVAFFSLAATTTVMNETSRCAGVLFLTSAWTAVIYILDLPEENMPLRRAVRGMTE